MENKIDAQHFFLNSLTFFLKQFEVVNCLKTKWAKYKNTIPL